MSLMSRGVTTSEKVVEKPCRGRLAGEGSIFNGAPWGEMNDINGFNVRDIVLAAEKAQVTAFMPRGTFSG